ncbi:tannase/feruloyl esterase family alpha/beta hydrolase [Sphingomonas sp.]|uniref:tannase/feruloyl esterase family alpha/beta hydrolase n=1 Tax=Sphingomonas sp. TaxID=28214 RepID=UPI002ED93E65
MGHAPRLIALAAAYGAMIGSPAAASNGYSFLDAGASRLDYSRADVAPAIPCKALMRAFTADLTIASAVDVPATGTVPAYCRVRGVITPEIQFEVRLPTRWNRRIYMTGNGGYGGQPVDTFYAQYRDTAIRHGFATAATNTGHDARAEPDATFAARNLQKKIDWAYRATHLTAEASKQLVRMYFDRAHSFAYLDGCSNGGRQGLISAQRFPQDFDGIVAGAPLLNFTETSISYLWTSRALAQTPIPAPKMPMIAAAVLRRCDAKDGVRDGLIADPRACNFDPARDLPRCSGDAGGACVTAAELVTLQKIRSGPPANGRPYVHGVLPGAEPDGVIYLPPNDIKTGWFEWVSDPRGPMFYQGQLAEQFLKYMAYPVQDPQARADAFDFTSDPARMTEGRQMVDALDPDLGDFARRGGKLLMYHGWADLGTNPLHTIDYFNAATARGGGPAGSDSVRLFLLPGMFHCFGGYGPDRMDAMTAIINWVEAGQAPDAIVAGKTERREGGRLLRTRPVCAYPKIARYRGSGSMDAATSFTCAKT